jgi:hypothetical protein
MTHLIFVILLEWSATATSQVRDRLTAEWTQLVAADKTFGTWAVTMHGRTFEGDWVVRHTDGWTYYLRGGDVRCRQQGNDYVTCRGRDFVPLAEARIEVRRAAKQPPITVAILRTMHRAIWNKTLDVDDRGRTTIETIVSEPPSDRRTSRRYRVGATLSAQSFSLDAPQLVEEFLESCIANHGCHSTHWHCQRITN